MENSNSHNSIRIRNGWIVCFVLFTAILSTCQVKTVGPGFRTTQTSAVGSTLEPKARLAVYVVEGISNPREVELRDLDPTKLAENPIFTEDDILSYDSITHRMKLTEQAYANVISLFSLPVDVDGIPFVVMLADEPIYTGAFYTPLSSISYDGVVILQPFDPGAQEIAFGLGYPSREVFLGVDPRSDSRIIDRLTTLNKLK